ncbi:MAG: hypothetical protein ABSE91_03030 [Patescibacteria group bacterium]
MSNPIRKIDGIYLRVRETFRKPKNKTRLTWGTIALVVLGILVFSLINFTSFFKAQATTYTCTASVSGNWNAPATWGSACESNTSAYPGWSSSNFDNVVINANITVTLTASVTNPIGTITITAPTSSSGTAVAIGAYTLSTGSASAAGTVTINGGTSSRVGQVSISTGTLNVGAAGGASSDITFGGTTGNAQLVFSGAGTVNLTGNFGSGSIAGVLTTTTGSVMNFKGTSAETARGYTTYNVLKSNNPAGVTLTSTATIVTLTIGDVTSSSIFADGGYQITDTGTLNLTSGTFTLGGTGGATTWPAFATRNIANGTTVNYAANTTQTVSNTPAYWNLQINGTAGAKSAGGALTVNGNFTIGGAATFTAGSYTHNFYGNWVINTTAATPITFTGSTINFNTPASPAATSITGTSTATLAFVTVNFNNTSGFSISTSGASTTVPISASGVATVASGVTVTNNGTATFTSSLTGSGGWTNAGTGILNDNFTGAMGITTLTASASGNTVVYGYAGAQTVFPSITYYNLKIQSSGAKTLTNVSTISGTFTVSGTCTATTAASMTAGTLTINGGTLTTGNNLSVSGNLTISSGGLSNGAYVFSVGGTLSISLNITFSSASGSATFTGDVTLNSGTVWNESAAQPINFGGSLTNNATTWTSSTGIHTFTGSGKTISGSTTTTMPNTTIGAGASVTNSGTVTISTTLASGGSGSTWTDGNGTTGTLNFGGSSIGVATFTASAASNTVNYNASGVQTVNPTSYYNLTLSGTSAKTMTGVTAIGSSLTVSGTATMTSNAAFTVTGALNYSSTSGTTTLTSSTPISIGQYNQTGSGGTLADNGNTITVTGTGASTWVKSAGTFTATGTVIFTGVAPQIGVTNFNNLTINVGGGNTATITGQVDTNGAFNLQTGIYNCNSQNQTYAGSFTLASGTTFTKGGTTTFDGPAGTDNFYDNTASLQDLGTVAINGSSGMAISAQTNMKLTTLNLYINNTLDITSKTLTIAGTGTPFTKSGTLTTTSSTVVYTGSGTGTNITTAAYNNLTLTPTSTTTYSLTGNLTAANSAAMTGTLTLSNTNATLNNNATNKYSIDLAGNWINSGTFTNNSGGTVTFTGAGGSTQIVSGNTSFYNFTATATTARTINFDSGSTTTVSGTWTCTGASGQLITLGRNGGSGSSQWNINPTAWSVDYVTPANSNNQAASPINPTHYTDDGNNTNWFVTNHPPNTPTSLTQGTTSGANNIAESAWTNVNQPWFGFNITDPDTGDTVKYEIQIDNTDSNFTHLVLDYTYGTLSSSGTTFAYQVGQSGGTYAVGSASMTLSDSSTGYWWRVYGIDNHGATSASPAYFGVQATVDLKVDATAPTGGSVTNSANTGSLTQLGATWSGFDATVSGLLKYQYAVGTTAGGSDIASWTDNGTGTSATATGLNLQTSINYYFSVKAFDNAGNIGNAVSASAQQVVPTLSFSLDSNTVTFSNLNAGNFWTDTKTTAVHTVTNAAGGYSVRAYANGLLTSIVNGALTIPNYASSYASPSIWSGTGFGYTSNDPDIGGVDKWTSSTKFCAFSQTAPGDIVADHEAAVNGSTGNADDIYTLTYKVVAPTAQSASTYQTIIYYISTANY